MASADPLPLRVMHRLVEDAREVPGVKGAEYDRAVRAKADKYPWMRLYDARRHVYAGIDMNGVILIRLCVGVAIIFRFTPGEDETMRTIGNRLLAAFVQLFLVKDQKRIDETEEVEFTLVRGDDGTPTFDCNIVSYEPEQPDLGCVQGAFAVEFYCPDDDLYSQTAA